MKHFTIQSPYIYDFESAKLLYINPLGLSEGLSLEVDSKDSR